MEQIVITFSAPADIKDLLEAWAKEDDRSVSATIRRIIDRERERREQMQAVAARVFAGDVAA